MMRGTRRIVLLEPNPTGEEGPLGGPKGGPPYEHVVYAVQDPASGSGDEGLISRDVLGAESRRTYRIAEDSVRRSRVNADGEVVRVVVNETWKVVDDFGQRLDIESVEESNAGPRRRWLRIQCKRIDPRGTEE